MKKYILYTLLPGFMAGVASCKMELDPYSQQENRIAFVFPKGIDSVARFTFAYFLEEIKTDTVWVEVAAIGHLSDRERKVDIVQTFIEGVENAESGVHFVPFDDASLATHYVIAGNATGGKLPVVVKRDPSLKTKEYVLEIRLKENDNFLLVAPSGVVKRIVLSDVLTKPNTWGGATNYYMGAYGMEKHNVMIAAATPYGVIINDEWIDKVINKGDAGYREYWISIFKAKLQEINDQRVLEGKGLLTEGPDYGKVIVSFK